MSQEEFRIGDRVWFACTTSGRNRWPEATIIYPADIFVVYGNIVYINTSDDLVHIYVEGEEEVVKMGYTFLGDYIFKSKEGLVESLRFSINNLN